jgi:predicted SnoaL-like aldol condensation-catalyzing enzyme
MSGTTQKVEITKTTPEENKIFVMEAFDTLFNKRDYAATERFWSSNYIQHSAHIPPGRDGLFGLIKSTPPEMKYENSLIMAEGDMVMLHGRFSGLGLPANWIVVDIIRLENGLVAEHWDVISDIAKCSEVSLVRSFHFTDPGDGVIAFGCLRHFFVS